MKQILLILLCIVSFMGYTNGQDVEKEINRIQFSNSEFIPRTMSPDVSSFMKVNYIPVSNYTGRAKIDIPIYTIKEGKITVPISISYNTGGVKVDDIASAVGLNWTLNAGGVVTKIVKGKEDCFYDYHGGIVESVGWLLKKDVRDKLGISNAPLGIFKANEDRDNDYEPDLFVGNAPGINLEFVHDLDQNVFELNKTGNKISSTFGSTETISFFDYPTKWHFINPNYTYPGGGSRKMNHVISAISAVNSSGVKYNFADIEVSQSVGTANYPSLDILETTKKRFTNEKIDNYHLSEILDRQNGKAVSFEYEKYQLNKLGYTLSFIQNSEDRYNQVIWYENNYTKYPLKRRIKRISFGKGSVLFNYDNIREDIPGEKVLTDIIVKDLDGKTIKHIKLNHDYFITGDGDDVKKKRLKLLSVYEIDYQGNKIPGYMFQYSNLELPKRGSSATDFLGYYNNKGNENVNFPIPKIYYMVNKGDLSLLPFKLSSRCYEIPGNTDITPSEKYTQAGILTKIVYPTGGTQELVYETNSFSLMNKEIKAGGLRIKKIYAYPR